MSASAWRARCSNWASATAQPDALGVLIVPPMTRQDIAAIVGTTLFTASRLLSEWEDRGLMESSRARVRLRSLEGLRLLASEGAGL